MPVNLRTAILAQIAELQAQLAQLDRVQPDTFPFDTIALFSSDTNAKWFYRKTAEETWLSSTNQQKTLAEWILDADAVYGYFEVYILLVPNVPFFASA